MILSFNACSKEPKVTIDFHEKKVPQWFLEPPISTSSSLYATADGSDKKTAIVNALNNIASTLSVSIQSEFQNSLESITINGVENLNQKSYSNVLASVKNIRISNYKVLKYEKLSYNRTVVLIVANKKDIFDSIKDEIDKRIKLTKSQERNYKNANPLNRLKFYKDAINNNDTLIYKSIILKILNHNFNDTYIVNFVSHFKTSYQKLKNSITFTLRSDKNSRNLVPVLKDCITNSGFRVISRSGKNHFDLTIRSKIIYNYAYGFNIARATITIKLRHKNQVVSTKQLFINGQATQGNKVAKENIAYKLKDLLNKKSLKAIINF